MGLERDSAATGFHKDRWARIVSLLIASLVICMVLTPTVSTAGSKPSKERMYVVGVVGDPTGTHLPMNNPYRHQYDDVADMLYDWDLDKFLMLGDAQHENGLLEDYLKYYDSEFGKLLDITAPIPGNHDYYWDWEQFQLHDHPFASSNGSGYFDYFGEIAHPPLGFYSFDLGSWHIIALNSEIILNYDVTEVGSPAYEQYEWLKSDLASHPEKRYPGTIAMLHHPLFTWETPGAPGWTSPELVPFWELLYAAGVDLVFNGHSHNYQRWAPQDPYGNYDADGITEFVVGTGGYYMNELGHKPVPENFVWGQDSEFGALKLMLFDGSYSFEFWSISGEVLDSGYDIPCN